MTDDQLNAMWYYAVGSGDPTAGNAHLRFARAVLAAQPAPADPTMTREELVAAAESIGMRMPATAAPAVPAVPVDMVLHCPACGLQHIDAPDPWVAKYGEELCKAKGFSLWTNPPHKSHLCHGCGHVWRPADVATAGVKAVSTKGKEDGPIKEPVARQTLSVPALPDKATTDYITTIEVLRAHIARLESAAPAVQPLTDEQIDEIWDGTFDSADPKRQLSFRQTITRAVERAHGITGDSK